MDELRLKLHEDDFVGISETCLDKTQDWAVTILFRRDGIDRRGGRGLHACLQLSKAK